MNAVRPPFKTGSYDRLLNSQILLLLGLQVCTWRGGVAYVQGVVCVCVCFMRGRGCMFCGCVVYMTARMRAFS